MILPQPKNAQRALPTSPPSSISHSREWHPRGFPRYSAHIALT